MANVILHKTLCILVAFAAMCVVIAFVIYDEASKGDGE